MGLITAVITARGGSKGLHEKNVREIGGKPLIAYSIEQCLNSRLIDRTIVSTDCEKIKKIAEKFGASCPFLRPSLLAQDDSLDIDVFKHFLNWEFQNYKYNSDLIVHIRPTSPIRPKNLIDECIKKILADTNADSLRTVIKADKTPYKMWSLEEKYLEPLLNHDKIKEPYNHPRQLLPTVYQQTATVDIFRPRCIHKYNSMNGVKILPFIVDKISAVDIDNINDFNNAEKLLNTK